MIKKPNISNQKPADKSARQEKLAAALRANLKRRKEAKRAMKQSQSDG